MAGPERELYASFAVFMSFGAGRGKNSCFGSSNPLIFGV